MDLQAWINAYLDHVRIERGLSGNTIGAYRSDLAGLAAHVGDGCEVTAVDGAALAAFLAHEAERGLGARSAARRLAGLRGFFRFLMREGVITADPTRLVDSPKFSPKLPRTIDVKDVGAMMNAAWLNDHHEAIIEVFYSCGLRVSEIRALDLDDIDLERGQLTVRSGKGGKSRTVPMAPRTKALLRRYIGRCRPAERGPALFVSPRGPRWSREGIWRIVRRLGERAGIPVKVHPHKLRHSFAVDTMRGGANLRAIQSLLGHAGLDTTAIYLRVNIDDVRAAHERAHPRG